METTQALGWALLHFIWQGALVASALALLLRAMRAHASTVRYALCVGALAAMLVLPVATSMHLHRQAPDGTVALSGTRESSGALVNAAGSVGVPKPVTPAGGASPRSDVRDVPTPESPSGHSSGANLVRQLRRAEERARSYASGVVRRALDVLPRTMPWLVRLWCLGVLVLSLKLLGGWVQAQRLARCGIRPPSEAVSTMLARLSKRLGLRRPVRVVESAVVQVPAVLGWLRPLVLIPASALSGLTPQQLEALVAHELAHVRRHDYLVNLLQSMVETLLFYHPAVWWVSRRIRDEREHCCDDLTLQVCTDPKLYVGALLEVERLRAAPVPLAAAATGGALVGRVRRILQPRPAHAAPVPAWFTGILGLAVVLSVIAVARFSTAVTPVGEPDLQFAMSETRQDGAEAAPVDLISHPDPTASLEERVRWAQEESRRRGLRTYWIGYAIRPLPGVHGSIYYARLKAGTISNDDVTIAGRITNFGGFEGFHLPGARLPASLGAEDDVALLFEFRRASGRAALDAVQAISLSMPIDLGGKPLLWLGRSEDAPSVALVRRLFTETRDDELRGDLVGAVGVHSATALVVPILVEWLAGDEPDKVREESIEWLALHPEPQGLAALTRAARGDRSPAVRRQAAESVGEMALADAGDSAVALARTLHDAEARREAVESLGARREAGSLQALRDIALHDPDPDVQREAVETLGERANGEGTPILQEILRSDVDADVRREAVETLGAALPAPEAAPILSAVLRQDPSQDVQREAVETLGEILPPAAAVPILRDVLRDGPSQGAQREAVETLARLEGGVGLDVVRDAARAHPDPDVRREALETLAREAPPSASLELLREVARKDRDPDMQRAALEALADVPDGEGIPTLIDIARTHPDPEMRKEALELLVDSDDPRARQLFDRALGK